MQRGVIVYRFGEFELDPMTRWLVSGAGRVRLTDPQSAVLVQLVANAPEVVGRDDLAKAGWGGVATHNSIEQAISRLRKTLGDTDGAAFIETVPNRGYRFVAPIEQREPQDAVAAGLADDEPFRAFVHARRELPTLNRHNIAKARRSFERTIQHAPDYAPAHASLAHACALIFEASRVDISCDLDALSVASEHGHRATMLDPALADGWSTLGFALYLNGETDAATVAAWKAVAIEPGSWRHWLRLAYVSWGDERIEAAQKSSTLRPDLALACWLQGTVLIARGAFDAAITPIRAGCTAQDKQRFVVPAYPAVGLHLLHGLVRAAQERLDEASEEFSRELAEPDRGQIYWRECAANTWYALGAVRLRRGDVGAATVAFRRALEIAPGHFSSMAALGLPMPAISPTDPRVIDVAIARAIALTRAGRHREAADAYRDAILSARVANAGWILPVEPILHASARPEIWNDALTIVQQRAT